MIQHEIIPPFSQEWWIYNVVTVILICAIILFCKNLTKQHKNNITHILAGLFLCKFIYIQFYHYTNDLWSIQESLPIHLCSFMWFLSIYFFITKKQWAFEMLLFIGMPGGIHSLLTPELTHGNTLIQKIDFFIGHGGLILSPFFGLYVLNMWPRKQAWIKSFFKLQFLVLIVALVNYTLNSNYMYLAHPPIANNPLIPSDESFFGQWPYYILIFELAVLIHAFLINLPFLYINTRKS